MNGREALIKAMWIMWRHYPSVAKDLGREYLKRWLSWAMSEGFLLFIMDDDLNRNVAGIVMVRPLLNIQDCYDSYTFDQEGPILWIDLMVSVHPDSLMAAGFAVLSRFGMRQTLAFKNNGKVFAYPATTFRRHLLRRNLIRK